MSKFVRAAIAACLVAAVPSLPAMASGSKVSSPLQLAKQAEKLKPGQWVWAGKIAPTGPILVYVDLGRQRATVYRNGVRVAVTTISSGKTGHDTPTGVFTILQKNKDHRSSTYNNAPMPYMQRLTWKGVALHAGNLPGYPAGVTPQPKAILTETGTFTWTPEAAPSGPVSIIISTGDQQVVVLRNGVEIGRAKALVQQQSSESQVMTYAGGKRPQWIQVGVSDLTGEPAEIISTQKVEEMELPQAFVTGMRSVIKPGTTVLVTQASVTTGSTGTQTTVLDADDAKN
jgi:hypothetical protein